MQSSRLVGYGSAVRGVSFGSADDPDVELNAEFGGSGHSTETLSRGVSRGGKGPTMETGSFG